MKAFLASMFFFTLLIAGYSSAESKPVYVEGKDFVVLAEPVRTTDPTKIEVAEAFAYPCHACFSFEPALESWIKSQSNDIVFVKSHVSFRPEWVPYQRGYYTVLSLKLKNNIDMDIFKEIHVNRNELNTDQAWANFLANYGVEKEKVIGVYNSFGVSSQMKQADARNNGFKITSTPTLIIDGRYKVGDNLKSYEQVLEVAQFLVDKVRAEKALAN